MIVSGVSGDGLIQAAATLIVGAIFFVILRQAIMPNKPVTRTFVIMMLVPVFFWVMAIVSAVMVDVVGLGYGVFAPAPTTTAASQIEELIGETGIRWGLLMLVIGLFVFLSGVAFTAGFAPSGKEAP